MRETGNSKHLQYSYLIVECTIQYIASSLRKKEGSWEVKRRIV